MRLMSTLAGLAIGGAVAIAVPVAALADHLADVEVTSADGTSVIEVRSEATGEQFRPDGGEPTDEFPAEDEIGPGDGFVFTEDLTQDGVLVGQDTGVCTILDADVVECEVTVTFADGTMTVRFQGVETDEVTQSYPISGGSGAYLGATGTVSVTELDPEGERSDITLTYRTPSDAEQDRITEAESGTQVALVPVGGAATGGGAAASTDSALLIAVGAAAVAGGAGLFGAARHAARGSA